MLAIKSLVVNPERCTGCHRCELWCSLTKWGELNPARALVFVVRREPGVDSPVICYQCGLCARVCPNRALVRDANTGAIRVDSGRCDGCGECVAACPYGVIRVEPGMRIAVKCDLCGGEPACVAHCPQGALQCQEVEAGTWRKRETWALVNASGPRR
ncbi:MAG: 4Fe-4S dicluster domain-containing protein [Bacillota bacterium]